MTEKFASYKAGSSRVALPLKFSLAELIAIRRGADTSHLAMKRLNLLARRT